MLDFFSCEKMNSVAVNNPLRWLHQESIDIDEENGALPKDYSKLVSLMRKANLIKDYKLSAGKVMRNSFKGRDLVLWIMKETKVKRADAMEIGQELIDKHFALQTTKEHGPTFSVDRYYQLVEEDHTIPLNNGAEHRPNTVQLHHYNETLREVIQKIFDKILSEDKRLVYLDRLDDNKDFKTYLKLIKEAANLDLTSTTTDQRLAFFVNIFNMMLVHITYKFGVPATIWHKKKYVFSTYYTIAGHLYSPYSILNGILRGNRKGIGMLWEPFGKEDRRLPLTIPGGEPLVHFAINNYTTSTAPIRTYSIQNVKNEMKENARKALHSEYFLRIDSTKKNIIYLNRIFKFYAIDFGEDNDEILSWILNVLDEGNLKDKLQAIYDKGQYSFAFLDIEWNVNHIKEQS
uniref:DEP domain-containing protein n=2 Tax=Acrobeloides nanus TaxID=290746 RepID=A0A914CNX4_9BILA